MKNTNWLTGQELNTIVPIYHHPVDTGRKVNVHNTFRRRPGYLLNVICMFNLGPVSTENIIWLPLFQLIIKIQTYYHVTIDYQDIN